MADELKTDDQITADLKGSDGEKVFTQDDVNRFVQKRVGEDSDRITKKILSELGVESIDDVKHIIKAKNDADEASKTELQKAQDANEALKQVNEELLSNGEKLKEKNRISKLASDNKVQDADYFEFKYSQAKKADDFNEDTFIESFTKGNPAIPPKTDTSSNNGGNPGGKDLRSMSIRELREYQATL